MPPAFFKMYRSLKQRTVQNEIVLSGRGLQTGKDVKVVCIPGKENAGIIFIRKDAKRSAPIRIREMGVYGDGPVRRSTIGPKGAQIQTVEHFLAALWGLDIDNLTVEVTGPEMPALDGSAAGFVDVIKRAGIQEQSSGREFIRITEPLEVAEGNSSLIVTPGEGLNISYFIDYDCASIGKEEFNIELDSESFQKEIAPARTFCLKKEVWFLLMLGLGGGATVDNTLVMDKKGPVGNTLRFANEPVRHKVLDLVGDLYLAGFPIKGKVTAKRSGHKLNRKMAGMIRERYVSAGKIKTS